MLPMLIPLITQGLKMGSKLIQDKDKQAEYAFKNQEMMHELLKGALSNPTYRWVDAIVKIMAAIIAFARPLGTFALTCWGIYLHVEGIEIPPWVHGMMDGAFPAWGLAREGSKRRKEKKRWFGRREDD